LYFVIEEKAGANDRIQLIINNKFHYGKPDKQMLWWHSDMPGKDTKPLQWDSMNYNLLANMGWMVLVA
jgi:hypothetical protein